MTGPEQKIFLNIHQDQPPISISGCADEVFQFYRNHIGKMDCLYPAFDLGNTIINLADTTEKEDALRILKSESLELLSYFSKYQSIRDKVETALYVIVKKLIPLVKFPQDLIGCGSFISEKRHHDLAYPFYNQIDDMARVNNDKDSIRMLGHELIAVSPLILIPQTPKSTIIKKFILHANLQDMVNLAHMIPRINDTRTIKKIHARIIELQKQEETKLKS
jgi:hypothetical protein